MTVKVLPVAFSAAASKYCCKKVRFKVRNERISRIARYGFPKRRHYTLAQE
jgi:hypothetical protein